MKRALDIFSIITCLLAALYFGGHFAYWMWWDATEPLVYRDMTDKERKEHKRLLRKHGDYPVYYYSDKPDQKFFTRNGKTHKWM